MKKYLLAVVLILSFGLVSKAQSYNSYLGPLDTLTNAQSKTYTVTVTGAKHCVSFQTNILKISGTVAGTIKVYGSVDGVNYGTTPITTNTLTDASVNWLTVYTSNSYVKYQYVVATTGTSVISERTYLLYRPQP